MDFFPEIEISALQAEAIARGLYGIAVVDGVHERELALISDFYHDAVSGEAPNAMASIERAGPLEPKELADQIEPALLRELFVKAGFLLGWADGKISPAERTKIAAFAKALEVSDATVAKLEAEVKDFLLRPFANLANIDAATVIAKKLGV
jgi:hypothetical protein